MFLNLKTVLVIINGLIYTHALRCSFGPELVVCKSSNLDTLPMLSTKVKEAHFDDNNIKEIRIQYDYLERLGLSNNRIKTVNWKSDNLIELDLSSNPLRIINLNAKSLEKLNVSECSINYITDEFFNNLPNLRELYVNNNPLKTIYENSLLIFEAQNALLMHLPKMDNLRVLDISRNSHLKELYAGNNLRTLRASNCKISKIVLNDVLKTLDVSSNQITSITLNEELEIVDLSWNSLRTIDIEQYLLRELNLSNNILHNAKITSKFLENLNLSRNPLSDLKVYCDFCKVDCSFCQVKKADLLNINFLNLTWNNMENIDIKNVKEIDVRYNLLSNFSSDAAIFDLRYNSLKDPNNLKVKGIGFLTQNRWDCDCRTMVALMPFSKNASLCEGLNMKKCFTKTIRATIAGSVLLISLFIGLIIVGAYFVKCHPFIRRNNIVRNDLPTYEEALEMAKPSWSRRNSEN